MLAQKNQHGPAKILSKDLVRQRQQINQYYTMASQMKTVQAQVTAAGMSQTVVGNLGSVNSIMQQVNGSMNPQQMMQTMKQFAMETEKMGIQQEMMQDQFDMVGDPGTDLKADDIYNEILAEVGMDINGAMATNTNQIVDERKALA